MMGIFSILALSVCILLFQYKSSNEQNILAEIYLNGEQIKIISLSAVDTPYSFTVEGENGTNIISVEHGRICVSEADCPDQICVHQGWVSGCVTPIVCLPNKLVIQFEIITEGISEEAIDGVIQ